MKTAAIVLSAGRGTRMQSDIPKQYMPLNDKPVLYYSLKAFQDSSVSSIILVTGKEELEFCQKEIIEKYNITKVSAVVPGGKERYHSVYEGLKKLKDYDYVLIHDGARPCVNVDIIERSIQSAIEEEACVVGTPVKDTIKIANENGYAVATPDRSTLWMIQTPQSFSYSLIYNAYTELMGRIKSEPENVPSITDDAMVVEYIYGKKVKLILGSYTNIKITTPEDIRVAEGFLKNLEKLYFFVDNRD